MKQLALALLLCSSFSLNGAESIKTLRAAIGDYPPYTQCESDELNLPANLATEIVGVALKSQGVELEISCYPWARVERLVETGVIDISFPYVHSDERAKRLAFIPMPVQTDTVLFYRKNMEAVPVTFESLSRYRLGGTLGYHYGALFDALDAANKVGWVPTDKQNFKKLLRGRIDFFPLSFHVGYYVLSQFPAYQRATITNLPTPIMVKKFNVIVAKDSPKLPAIRKLIEKGFETIRSSGELSRIQDNYLAPGS
ncbi:substrate-binding periplasmic protein [Dongshaea marina]|uniref:substrate-binding periplasmic protein n=1 Tax=Dongshaea marina TaxID=2047966 RepID=UPI00131EF035|nr:transporter substrate-binding domain-containing protein [Dongshaea marina]